jgi:hypothetical protein
MSKLSGVRARERETFTLTLAAEPHPTPAHVRLKQALKLLGRAFAFRCVSVAEAPRDVGTLTDRTVPDRTVPDSAGASGE